MTRGFVRRWWRAAHYRFLVIEGGVSAWSPPDNDGPVVLDGRYELAGLLGVGGMAKVHRGRDRLLGRPVAVKVFHRHLLEDPVTLMRARSEIRVLARLDHPHLVRLYDASFVDAPAVGRGAGCPPYMVMELVDGSTLADAVRGRPMEPAGAAAVGAGLAEALAHVHAAGVVHRDVKPANVLLADDGTAKLTDFGIALLGGDPRHTSTGMLVGTAGYLAPEQIRGGTVTGATDVHALGLVVLECLTGAREYPGTGVTAAVARVQRAPEVPAALAGPWAELLTAMTHDDPSQRPSAADVALALHALGDHGPTQVLPLVGTADAAVDRPVGRRWAIPVAAAVVLLGALGAALAVGVGASAPVAPTTAVTPLSAVSVPVAAVAPPTSAAASSSPAASVANVVAPEQPAAGARSAAATATTLATTAASPPGATSTAAQIPTTPAAPGTGHGNKPGNGNGNGPVDRKPSGHGG